ncbi:uncharacterized protein LOC144292783 isoform X2 [Canis aureus]
MRCSGQHRDIRLTEGLLGVEESLGRRLAGANENHRCGSTELPLEPREGGGEPGDEASCLIFAPPVTPHWLHLPSCTNQLTQKSA